MKLSKCPLCGSKKIQVRTGNYSLVVGKRKVIVPEIKHWRCETCKEYFLGDDAMMVLQEYQRKRKKAA